MWIISAKASVSNLRIERGNMNTSIGTSKDTGDRRTAHQIRIRYGGMQTVGD